MRKNVTDIFLTEIYENLKNEIRSVSSGLEFDLLFDDLYRMGLTRFKIILINDSKVIFMKAIYRHDEERFDENLSKSLPKIYIKDYVKDLEVDFPGENYILTNILRHSPDNNVEYFDGEDEIMFNFREIYKMLEGLKIVESSLNNSVFTKKTMDSRKNYVFTDEMLKDIFITRLNQKTFTKKYYSVNSKDIFFEAIKNHFKIHPVGKMEYPNIINLTHCLDFKNLVSIFSEREDPNLESPGWGIFFSPIIKNENVPRYNNICLTFNTKILDDYPFYFNKSMEYGKVTDTTVFKDNEGSINKIVYSKYDVSEFIIIAEKINIYKYLESIEFKSEKQYNKFIISKNISEKTKEFAVINKDIRRGFR